VSSACPDPYHCTTCSDEGVPLRVVEVRGDGTALCADGSEVMTELVGRVEPGDVVLVHAGTALALLAESPEAVLP
jgi:hydrogenase expression/formation protein HypC